MTTKVWCTFRLVGFHNWPEAPDEVSYLQARHRHEFHFKVIALVTHQNRQIEIHTLKRYAIGAMAPWYSKETNGFEFKNNSCEFLARWLFESLHFKMGLPVTMVSVDEDGENGATYEQ